MRAKIASRHAAQMIPTPKVALDSCTKPAAAKSSESTTSKANMMILPCSCQLCQRIWRGDSILASLCSRPERAKELRDTPCHLRPRRRPVGDDHPVHDGESPLMPFRRGNDLNAGVT